MTNTFKQKLLLGTALVAVAGFAAPAIAADDFDETGLTGAGVTVQVEDADASDDEAWSFVTDPGSLNDTINFNDGAGNNVTNVLTVTGGATTTGYIGTISITDDADNGATHKLVVGNGAAVTTLVVGTAVNGDGSVDAEDLDIVVDADDGAGTTGAAATLDIDGATFNIGAGGVVTLDDDSTANGANATLSFTGTTRQTITAANNGTAGIVGAAAGEGTLLLSNTAGIDLNADVDDLEAITIGAGTTVDIGDAGASDIDTFDATTITLGSGAVVQTTETGDDLTITGNIEGAATGNGTLNFDSSVTIVGNVGATNKLAAIDIADSKTLTIAPGAQNVELDTANGLNLGDDGTDNNSGGTLALNISNGQVLTVNTAITTSTNSEGRITIANGTSTVDFNADVGTSSKKLQSVAVAGGANNTVTVAGNWYVDATTLDDLDVLRFDGTTQTVSGTIDGVNDDDGHLIVGNTGTNSTVTFNGNIGTTGATALEDLTVVSGSTAIFSGASNEFDDAVIVDGTLRLSQNTSTEIDDWAVGAATGSLQFVIGTSTTGVNQNAILVVNEQVDWDQFDGTTANYADTILKQGTGVILNGQDFLIVDGTAANVLNLAAAGETVDDEYALFSFKAYTGDVKVVGASNAQDVVVEATHVDTDSVTRTTNNARAADGILDVTVAQYGADSTDGKNELALVYDNVTRATTSQIDERLEAIQPTVDGGNVVAATTVSNITSNIIQLASTDAEGSGIAAGNISNGLRAWAQVFGQTGDQDDRDGIDGYDIDTWGFAVGLDTQALADQMVIGLAFSYADSEVDSDNANHTNTEIDTYQITLYGTYNVDEATYISGQLGYAFGDNETDRYNLGGVGNVDAHGEFDSDQFIARLEAGRAYEVGSMTTLTPKVLANYNYYDADSYTETGAGGAGLRVDQDTLHVFELGAGVDADWMFQQADGSYLKPQVRLGFRYDLADDEVEATSRFIGGGTAFRTEGFDPQQFAVDAGVGVTYFATSNWELTANYDYEWKEDYDSHAGFLRAAYKF